MLLILTNSRDASTDMLMERLRDIPLFRLDVDLWREYAWGVHPRGFTITRAGECCDSSHLRLVHVRKPDFFDPIEIPKEGSLENWCREEIHAVWRSIHDHCHALGKVTLVHPGNGRWGKIRQMWLAQRFFKVPEWNMMCGTDFSKLQKPLVVKANTGALIGNSTFFSVREANPAQLNPQYPWFFQNKVEAEEDVTVAYVRGKLFAYALSRSLFSGMDCRRPTAEQNLEWNPCSLTAKQETAIREFMKETGFSFGRLDFLRNGNDLWFLEVNPNGMWAWLDLEGENGLLDAIVEVLRDEYEKASQGIELPK